MSDDGLVTRIYMEGGHYVRASEGIDQVASLISDAPNADGWAVVADPGTGLEKYIIASRVLWLEQENADA